MRVFLHDYAGHPIQVGLSRALCRQGHEVTHAYFSGDQGPKGDFASVSQGGGPRFLGIESAREYRKDAFVSRRFADIAYGRNLARHIAQSRPDVVLSGNTPTEAQQPILAASHAAGAAFVYWLQDFYSIAASRLLRRKLGAAGALVGSYYRWLERRQLRASDGVVLITEDFRELAQSWAGDARKVATIENWGPLDEISLPGKDNPWAREHGLAGKFVFLYCGTLALKHDPQLLIALARQWRDDADVAVVAVAQGVGADRLCDAKRAENLSNLILLPLQAIGRLSEVLASADVLVAVVERDAGTFSVPSKVQTYLCAQRAILLSAPPENLASRTVDRTGAGFVTPPGDYVAFTQAAARLRRDPALRASLAQAGRTYAESTYDIERIAERFEAVLSQAVERFAYGARAEAPR